MQDLSRRDVIRLGAAATVAASVSAGDALSAQPAAAGFFTREELALVDELAEMIIPADAHSPGARAANVAGYIDARLAEAADERVRKTWREGLKLVEQRSQEAGSTTFLQSPPAARVALLTGMAQNEAQPKRPEEVFFAELKSRVVHAYYTSEIGIQRDMEYKGNTYLAEFVGTDVTSVRP
jgi:hypothetical protein